MAINYASTLALAKMTKFAGCELRSTVQIENTLPVYAFTTRLW